MTRDGVKEVVAHFAGDTRRLARMWLNAVELDLELEVASWARQNGSIFGRRRRPKKIWPVFNWILSVTPQDYKLAKTKSWPIRCRCWGEGH